ncbi:MAG: glycine cleavage system aminomethyltransferase GcvT [Holophagales bacterium]|nr:glycine cleavage system aminomethyltransferase GcvT [Holophagales bacterium]
MAETPDVKRTALYPIHVETGAKMVDFAGWSMPVRYTSEQEEHRAVRTAAGLFDVSHMGEFRVRGDGDTPTAALDYLQGLTPNNVAKLAVGQAHYSALLTEDATYVDDLLVYRLAADDFLLVVNASNIDSDFAHMAAQDHPGCTLEDHSDRYALLALQGPAATPILARLTDAPLDDLRYYHFLQDQEVAGARCLLSRTGYTGELGFELYLDPDDAPEVWRRLLESGADDGLLPCGLAARDTLRLEAGMALYGHEIHSEVTPYEAGLGWTVKLKKGEFRGRDVLSAQKAEGVRKKLAGFEVTGKGIARQGYGVLHGGERVGEVASGTWAPTLGKAIGTVHLPKELTEPGTELDIEVRRRTVSAVVVPMPFYKRA